MNVTTSNSIKTLSKNRKITLFIISCICLIPITLNIIGFDFSLLKLNNSDEISILNIDTIQKAYSTLYHLYIDCFVTAVVIIAALIALNHFRIKQEIFFAIISIALFSLAVVNIFHIYVVDNIVNDGGLQESFLPFIFSLSNILNAVILFFVAFFSLWCSKEGANSFILKQSVRFYIVIGTPFLLIILIAFWGMVINNISPQIFFPDSLVTRPYDILLLAIFCSSGVLLWLGYIDNPSLLRFMLMLSILPLFMSQAHLALGSLEFFENHFNIAHFLNALAFIHISLSIVFIPFIQNKYRQGSKSKNDHLHKRRIFSQPLANSMNANMVKWPLALKIPLLAFLFSLLISLIIAFTFYVESYALVKEKEMSRLSLEAEIIKPLFSEFYDQSSRNVSFLSATPPIKGLITAKNSNDEQSFSLWQSRLNSIFIELLKTKPHYKRMSFISTANTNDVVVSAIRNNDKVESLTKSELPKDIQVTSLKNMLTEQNEGIYFSKMSFEGERDTENQILNPQSSFFVAKAIYEPDTNILFGIVAIEVDVFSYIKKLTTKSLKGINFYIADEEGDFLFFQAINQIIHKKNMFQEFPFLQEVVSNKLESEKVYDFGDYNEFQGLAYFSKLTFEFSDQVPPLYLLIGNHNDQFTLAIDNMRSRVILISLSLALFSLVISIFAARKLIKPLVSMTRSLSHYEQKGTIGELPTKEQDEIGLLARSFYHLFDTIEHKSFELKHVANQAESATLKLQAILNSIVDAVITIDVDGKILAFNKSATTMFGYLESEVINQNIKILMPPRFSKHPEKYIKSHLISKKPGIIGVGRELLAVKKNGDVFHMLLTINEINSETGTLYTGLIRDITESRQLEVEKKRILFEAKNAAWRLNFALSAPRIGVWDFDLESKLMLWDERMYLLFNIDPGIAENPKVLWQKMIHQDDRKGIEELLKEAVHSDRKIHYQHRIILPSNEVRYIEAHAQVMHDENGNKVSIVGTYRDYTEQRQLQDLKQNALDMAEESLRLKSEFLASMSHEIRTPMNGVLGMLGLLEQSALSKQQAHHLSLANSSAHSLLALINDILDFSKIEAGKLELEILAFDIRKQFGELAESMAIRAHEKNLELVLDLTEIKESMVKGDPSRLRQILSNLVGNAIKFTNSGEVVIKASVKEEGNQLKLFCRISDTGIGIPSDKVEHLFDSFTQVDATTTRKFGGTGLGLAIVKQLCDLMGGHVAIESEVNKGCCISFSINLESNESLEKRNSLTDFQAINLLIVDDNITNLNAMSSQFEIWGANVTQASSGIGAIDIIEKSEKLDFSHILIDMNMPNMDGLTLGKRISEIMDINGCHLILMTSMNEKLDSGYFTRLGFTGYFPKPATTNDLLSIITTPPISHNTLNAPHQSGESKTINVDTLSKEDKLPKNGRILLVEDNRINQAVILGVLANIDLHADVAENGLDAISMLMNSEVDDDYELIIMDCQMPELDGYETTKMIRKGDIGKRYQSIPIIAMTANAMKGDEDKCFNAGMSDYATKPVDASILQLKLCKWLGEREQTVPENENNASNDVIQPIKNEVDISCNGEFSESIDKTLEEADKSNETWLKEEFLNRIRNNKRLATSLINLFIEESPELFKALQKAIEQGESEAIVQYAHKLKGSARNLGGNSLGELCEYIENNPRDIDKEQVNLINESLKNEFNLLIKALESFND